MDPVVLYHNPRCSKSRAALALLEENGITPEIVYYLDNPPDVDALRLLLGKLDIGVRELLRKNEPEYEKLGLDDDSLAEEIVLDLVSRHPRLIQRPIIIRGESAFIARPPERVLSLVENS